MGYSRLMPRLLLATACAAVLAWPCIAVAQDAPVKGAAVLTHPLGALATRSVDLIAAGRFDEVMAMRGADDRKEWKSSSAADRQAFSARLKDRAPTPAVFAKMVREGGELTVDGDNASLIAETAAGMLRQTFVREAGQWRVEFGPMLLASEGAAAPPVTRIEGAELTRHPATALVLQYADLVHAGRLERAIATLGSTKAQAAWKALPAAEKKESATFRRGMLPTRAALSAALASGGVLLVEGETATLNVITMTPATAANSRGTSTTVAIPLVQEQGQWKLAQ